MPFKSTDFVRRAESVPAEAVLSTWLQHHEGRVRQTPGLTGLVFNLVDHARSPGTRYDAAIEYWFADEAAYRASTPLADSATGFIASDVMTLHTREVVIRAQPPERAAPRAKRIGLVGRRPETSQPTFFHEWVDVHAPPVDRQPGLERYVLNLTTTDLLPALPWDGYAQLWWTDWDAYENARATIQTGLRERLAFFDAHELLLVDEHVSVPPPEAR